MNYSDKITATIKRIQTAANMLDRYGGQFTVCFSGGKDSEVMLHLFQMAGVPFRAIYNVTTVDHPQNVNFIRVNYAGIVDFIHPTMNFWQIVLKKKLLPIRGKRFCCDYLKEYFGSGIIASGVRREESTKRKNYCVIERDYKKKHTFRFYPIIDWLEWEIWQYIDDNDLPINPCYDKSKRVGCMICPYSSTKELIAVFNEFPSLKRKMLLTIHQLRKDNYASNYKDKTDEELLHWWMSKKSMEEYFQPRLFD